jgi:GDP-L-fucose synthase
MTVDRDAAIFVAGHRGLVGSAIRRKLEHEGYRNVLVEHRSRLDLRQQASTMRWFEQNRPDYVYLAAGTVGGIGANSRRQAEFLYDNMMIHANVIEASRRTGVTKLLYLGSACVYPRLSAQPISEDELLTGPLEPTNEGYALAKIAGVRLCDFYRQQYGRNFIAAMPTNLYGPGDNFDLESSHVLPALMRKFHEAKERGEAVVEVWGTGAARREFMYVDDLAACCLFLMDNYDQPGHVNVGTGVETSIAELAEMIRDLVHPGAEIAWDLTRPDGMPRRSLDVTALGAMGWTASTDLEIGLARTYAWYLDQLDHGSLRTGGMSGSGGGDATPVRRLESGSRAMS